ncbi:hypothetical protein RN001_004060 [Aquatica leii]|uniref:TOG domain-containing protein n=1 Tax=Aquatica leii TaxID=1421715 RepID=A0AAN7SMM1_9COLE|nr:hypothetical protein RN001_004060 [Aquatica leii]
MIKYSEQLLSTPLKTPSTFKSSSPTPSNDIRRIASASGHDNRFSLTPLWEFVVRTKSLPESFDLNIFFQVVHERLQNPEREVRQHALRVLSDVITVIDSATLDSKMEVIIPDLITNMGHIGPAVRKGAIDCLKVYLGCSNNSDDILKDIVYNGVERSSENKMKSNVVTGIIIALPFLIKKVNRFTLVYVIRIVSEKMVQITYQETALKSLVRIKDIIGDELFDACVDSNFKKDFGQLCEVYNVDLESDVVVRKTQDEIIEDKVILETEIKLNSGPAITMQIHEESRQSIVAEDSEDDERNSLGIVKVLTDDSEDYYEPRRTPRRVRFGGEIVKLRTPDSDSNQPSDLDNDSTITITPRNENGNKPVIEIHYNDTKSNRAVSHIPVKKPKQPQSEPTSPTRVNNELKKLSRSSPNLSNANVFGEKVSNGSSKIPRRNDKIDKKSVPVKDQKLSHTTTIQIKFSEPRVENKETKNTTNLGKKLKKPPLLKIDNVESKNDDCLSPDPAHKEIEIFHNLTRSPERKKDEPFFQDDTQSVSKADTLKEDVVEPDKDKGIVYCETIQKDVNDVVPFKNYASTPRSNSAAPNTYSSFQVCSTTNFTESQSVESPIPTNDNGDCLTCSSSGSDVLSLDNNWEDIDLIDSNIIRNLKCKDDWRIRLRGLEDLNKSLQDPKVLKASEKKASSLLYFLFGCEQHVRLQIAAEDTLKIIFSNMAIDVLRGRLGQIVTALCKMGSPAGVRLSILLMRRITADEFLNQLLSNNILKAKSSKIREGALQILMTISRIFPSTEVNVPKAVEFVTPLLRDRKKRVRRASLETIASLAQLGSPATVLDVLSHVASEYSDKEQLIRVIRARLSRKQLPAVDPNGSVRYSTPSGDSELEWISIGSATGSPLSTQSVDTVENVYEVKTERLDKGHIDRINYWKSNARRTHNTDADLDENEEESDWSQNSNNNKDDAKSQNLQIWAVDPWALSAPVKLSASNGTLRPLYVIQKEAAPSNSSNSADSYKARSPRGRSYSPPKRNFDTNKSEKRERFVAVNKDEECFQNLHKSISSDQIRHGKSYSCTSSSNSDASVRTNNWSKNFKSAIPVPVSSDSRLRFRTRHGDVSRGPFSIPAQFYRTPIVSLAFLPNDLETKSPTPERTPDRNTVSQRSVLVQQPFSSGSESSEFCTPPAEPHLSNPVLEESPRQTESFIEVDSPRYHSENFTVIESAPDVLEENKTFSRANSANSHVESVSLNVEDVSLDEAEVKPDTEESFQTQDEFEEEHEKEVSEIRTSQTITINDLESFNVQKTYLESNLSKSEVNLQISTEVSRKSVSSAPALNDTYQNKEPDWIVENITLPGTVNDFSSGHTITTEIKTTPKVRQPLTRQLSRKNSVRSKRDTTTFVENLNPFLKPKEAFNETMALLDHNDWEMTMKGLQGAARLTRHHPDICDLHMHAICAALGKQIKNLRSQVARAACTVTSEMFTNPRRSLEVELEEIAVPLLHRTADTNKFLRGDANAALDKMCLHLAPPRVVSIIAIKGGKHQNAIVRCAAARLLSSITTRLGAEKVFQLPKDTRDKILYAGANMLMEGNLDTRKHAKIMFGNLIGHSQFNKAMAEAVPACTIRHIQKTLKSLQ